MALEWTERILDFPVRAAAVDSFLRDLKAKRAADLNAVLVTLNEGGLCREALRHWLLKEWIVVAPHSPLTAMTGPAFTRDLTLRAFCGERPDPESLPPFEEDGAVEGEGHRDDS